MNTNVYLGHSRYLAIVSEHGVKATLTSYVESEANELQTDVVLIAAIVGYGVLHQEGAVLPIKNNMSLQSGHKDRAVVLCQYVADEGSVPAILCQLIGLRIVDEETLPLSANPDATVLASHNVLHSGTDAYTIFCALVEALETVGLSVVHIETEGTAKPDIVAVFIERSDGIVLNAALSLNHVAVDGVLHAVKTIQAIVCAQPHESESVAQTTEHIIVAQAVGSHIIAENSRHSPRQTGCQEPHI